MKRRALAVASSFALCAGRAAAADPATLPPASAAAPAVTATVQAAAPPAPAPPKPPAAYGDLQSPELSSTRYSAYSLPRRTWAFDIGALGIGGGDVFANLGAAYGFGGGFQVEMNLAHFGVGLTNVDFGYHFLGTRYFDLGARLGIGYGRGEWFWLAQGAAKNLVSKIDLVNVPIELVASSLVTRWLELDLAVHYDFVKAFGSFDDDSSLFVKAELAVNQVFLRPGARVFVSDRTALELFAKLPLYSAVPLERKTVTVPFDKTWSIEAGVRSRLAGRVFGNLRLHYGSIADVLYGARLYPSFDVEFRF